MGNFTKIVICWGKIVLCYPHFLSTSRKRPFSRYLLAAVQFLTAVLVMTIFLDSVLSNSSEAFAGSSKLSEHIALYIVYFAAVSTDFLIRIISLLYAENKLNLIAAVMDVASSSCVPHHRWRKFCFLSGFTLAITLWTIGSICSIMVTDLYLEFVPEYKLTLLGQNERAIRLAYIVTDVWAVCSTVYAWAFLCAGGLSLVGKLHAFVAKCEETALAAQILGEGFLKGRYGKGFDDKYDNLKRGFMDLKESFNDFGKVGGGYACALLLNCTLHIITFLSTKIGFEEKSDNYQHNSYYNVLASSIILAAILIPSFGNHLTTEVSRHSQRLEYIAVRLGQTRSCGRIATLFHRIAQWRWTLNALDLFEINSSLIPKIFATVLTYFIVLFQLKSSENG